jgi:cell division protein FtsN
MAAKRPRTQARKRGGRGGPPGWLWLLAGVLLAAIAFVVLPRWLGDRATPAFLRPEPDASKQPRPAAADDEDLAAPEPAAAAHDANPTGAEAHYDFYTLLPGKETAVSDADLAAQAKAEQSRADASADAPTAAADTATATSRTPPAAPASVASATTPRTPTTIPNDTAAHYVLQAGAYQASGDAESLKAKIALLGLGARVESADIGGRTVYRVRLGPYGSARELAAAKQALQAGGIQTIAVRAN